nr:hypothetical protein [Tanacetum cinerariifolium]
MKPKCQKIQNSGSILANYPKIETTDEGTKILAIVDGKPKTISESSIRRNLKLKDEAGISSLPDAELFKNLALMGYNILPNQKFTFQKDIPTLRQYSRRARIAQSSALPTATDEPASPLGDDSQGEACPAVSGLKAGQDRANIIKFSTLPHDSTPRVTSLTVDEGNKDGGGDEPFGEDATIKGMSLETVEEAAIEKSAERGKVVTISVPTGSGLVPTASLIFPTASVVTPYSRQKAREMEEQLAREDQRMDEQITRDAKIARIHSEEELQMLIDSLDRNNETIAKYLQKYKQFAKDLSIRERIELINDLVKYQDKYAKVLNYQSQQRKPLSKKQQREFYMSVLKSHSGWKTKHFKGMSLEEIREKFIPIWKQIEDFVPMGSKEEGERVKRKGLTLELESAKKVKTSEEVSEEDLK